MEFSLLNIGTLLMLILLQAVLGFDNLLYISLESKRAPENKRKFVRTLGVAIAIVLRIGLLFLLVNMLEYVQTDLFSISIPNSLEARFNGHSIIVLFGGVFILYTAIKEIWHMMNFDPLQEGEKGRASTGKVIAMIVLMNVLFSFDSILGAIALTDVLWIMITAIIISGLLMIWLAEGVSKFLEKNRMYEVLGLFVLLIVGIMLLTEGGELAHIEILGNKIVKMNSTTFYFVITILILIDVVQGKYQKKLLKKSMTK